MLTGPNPAFHVALLAGWLGLTVTLLVSSPVSKGVLALHTREQAWPSRTIAPCPANFPCLHLSCRPSPPFAGLPVPLCQQRRQFLLQAPRHCGPLHRDRCIRRHRGHWQAKLHQGTPAVSVPPVWGVLGRPQPGRLHVFSPCNVWQHGGRTLIVVVEYPLQHASQAVSLACQFSRQDAQVLYTQ